jgi:hypothetical protein
MELIVQTKRILLNLVELWRQDPEVSNGAEFHVGVYLPGEVATKASEHAIEQMWQTLETSGAVELNRQFGLTMMQPASTITGESLHYRQEYWLKILKIRPIEELLGMRGADYDARLAILYIGDASVQIRPNSMQASLLKAIFGGVKPLVDEWNADEMLVEMGYREDEQGSDDWRKVYTAASAINARVLRETDVHDLLIVTIHTVRLNSDYIPKS